MSFLVINLTISRNHDHILLVLNWLFGVGEIYSYFQYLEACYFCFYFCANHLLHSSLRRLSIMFPIFKGFVLVIVWHIWKNDVLLSCEILSLMSWRAYYAVKTGVIYRCPRSSVLFPILLLEFERGLFFHVLYCVVCCFIWLRLCFMLICLLCVSIWRFCHLWCNLIKS